MRDNGDRLKREKRVNEKLYYLCRVLTSPLKRMVVVLEINDPALFGNFFAIERGRAIQQKDHSMDRSPNKMNE